MVYEQTFDVAKQLSREPCVRREFWKPASTRIFFLSPPSRRNRLSALIGAGATRMDRRPIRLTHVQQLFVIGIGICVDAPRSSPLGVAVARYNPFEINSDAGSRQID